MTAGTIGEYFRQQWAREREDGEDDDRFPRRHRNRNNCSDGMCGADDCARCHPENEGVDFVEEEE
jgi:hypothetical protein